MSCSNEIFDLIGAVKVIDKITDEEWNKGLSDRKTKELEFHNRDRDEKFEQEIITNNDTYEQFYGNRKYYRAAKRSKLYVQDWITRESKNKVFLDYACGNGDNVIHACKSGAKLALGFDISSISIKNGIKSAEKENLKINKEHGVCFFQADAENTKLPDDCIDTVVCSGMLHHLDLSYAFPELRRILKPNGKILVVEALDYNPVIKLYRMLTPDMRTEWEKNHILSLKDVNFASRFFAIDEIYYWHVLGYIGGKITFLFPLLDHIDRFIEKIPYIQRLAWIFTFVMRKEGNN
jgi:ubiquinone/menaquinone biosynthesis C-methylase UbiE|tara:strand:- start:14 stop:889 length:876 start_codon:yes stop_codon:yes gene_type:complete